MKELQTVAFNSVYINLPQWIMDNPNFEDCKREISAYTENYVTTSFFEEDGIHRMVAYKEDFNLICYLLRIVFNNRGKEYAFKPNEIGLLISVFDFINDKPNLTHNQLSLIHNIAYRLFWQHKNSWIYETLPYNIMTKGQAKYDSMHNPVIEEEDKNNETT